MPEPGPGSRDGQACPRPAVGGGGRGQGQGDLHSTEPLAWNVSARPGRQSTQAAGGGMAGPELRQHTRDYSAKTGHAVKLRGESSTKRGGDTHPWGKRNTICKETHSQGTVD